MRHIGDCKHADIPARNNTLPLQAVSACVDVVDTTSSSFATVFVFATWPNVTCRQVHALERALKKEGCRLPRGDKFTLLA